MTENFENPPPEKRHQENSPETEKENLLQPEQEVQKPPLAEGMDADDRFEKIKDELKKDWEKDTGKSITSEEGQNFLFGNMAEGDKAKSLEDRAEDVFAERFPDDTKEYAEKEKTRVYENPADDPAVKQVEEDIARITNQAPGAEQSLDVWDRNFNRATFQEWDRFLDMYPEKAAAYQKTFEPVKQAFERPKRSGKSNERKEDGQKTIYDEPAFQEYLDNPQTGLIARVQEKTSNAE